MRIAACSDVHAPDYLDEFISSLKSVGKADLLLLAGDLVRKNDLRAFEELLSSMVEIYDGAIYACFGNEEYEQDWPRYREFGGINWLEDEGTTIDVGGTKVLLVGSKGVLDRPTFWQRKNIPNIREIYLERLKRLDSLLRSEATIKIVITHYAPTYLTLKGEKESVWPEMGSRKLEEVIRVRKPTLWVHGHAHNGEVKEVRLDETLVVNVSLPARGGVTVIEVPERKGLDMFF